MLLMVPLVSEAETETVTLVPEVNEAPLAGLVIFTTGGDGSGEPDVTVIDIGLEVDVTPKESVAWAVKL